MRINWRFHEWAPIVALVANAATAVTLVFLVYQVRENIRALERQAVVTRAQAIAGPFLGGSTVTEALAKIKVVDGADVLDSAFMARYKLTFQEASTYVRYLAVIWTTLEADYVARGPASDLEGSIRFLLTKPDCVLFWDQGADPVTNAAFRSYVDYLRKTK